MLSGAAFIAVTGQPHTEIGSAMDPPEENMPPWQYQLEDMPADPHYYGSRYPNLQPRFRRRDDCQESKQELKYLSYELADLSNAISALAYARHDNGDQRRQPYYYFYGDDGQKTDVPGWLRGRRRF
ncbi:hypothetical protein SNE40_017139 [Patella caerulea]